MYTVKDPQNIEENISIDDHSTLNIGINTFRWKQSDINTSETSDYKVSLINNLSQKIPQYKFKIFILFL